MSVLSMAGRSAWARKRRLGGTVFAVFLGVALLAGTFVLSDTLGRGIKGFFSNGYGGVDTVVRSEQVVEDGPAPVRAPLADTLVRTVAAVPGVAVAEPVVSGYAQIVGPDGRAVTGNGPRNGGNWLGSTPVNPWRIAAGRAPRAADEVVIDKATADGSGLHAGSRTTVLAPGPHRVTVVGVAKFGRADALGGTSYVGFTLDTAQRWLGTPGRVDSVQVRAAGGVSSAALTARVSRVLPASVQAVTGQAATREAVDLVDEDFLSMFRAVAAGLAALSLLVAIFSIFNTQSILAAQRTRESALLRALGASRRQIFGAAIAEAGIVGAVASALGVGGGLLLTLGLKGVFSGMNLTLPGSGLAVDATSVGIAFGVGVVVTVLASLVPARRAAAVAPLAALRAVDEQTASPARRRGMVGAALAALGLAATVIGIAAAEVLVTSIGALAVVTGVIVAGPALAGPAVGTLTAPWSRRRGSAVRLAGRNARRDPHRVAGAATALLVGTALVALATVLAGSLRASADAGVAGALRADLVISPASGNGAAAALGPQVGDVAERTDGVRHSTALGTGTVVVGTDSSAVSVVDPGGLAGLVDLDVRSGSLAALRGDSIAVRRDVANERDLHAGSAVAVTYPDGKRVTARVAAVFAGTGLVEDVVVPARTWASHSPQTRVANVLVDVDAGTSVGAVRDRLDDALAASGHPPVRDRAAFIEEESSQITMALNLVYVMLALAVIIAVLGIANTIGLSVLERTRELGMMRAVGLTRRQARTGVRIEAVLVAALGSLAGVVLGAAGAAAVVAASDSATLSQLEVPGTPLLIVLLGGAVSGVLAAVRPARRAARTDVLAAVAAT